MATEVRMTIRLPKEADRFLAKVAKADFTSKNAQIVRIIRAAMQNEKGPAEAATSPSHDQNHPKGLDGGDDA